MRTFYTCTQPNIFGNLNMRIGRTPPEGRGWISPILLASARAHLEERLEPAANNGAQATHARIRFRWSKKGAYRFGDYQSSGGFISVYHHRVLVGYVCCERTKEFLGRSFRRIRGRRFDLSIKPRRPVPVSQRRTY